MGIQDDLRQFIGESLDDGAAGTGIGEDEPLLATGRIDSLGLIKLLGYIQQKYAVDLMSVAQPEDFQSIRSLAAALERHRTRA